MVKSTMIARAARLRSHHAGGLVNLSPRTAPAEAFTVIHGGAEIDESLAAGLLDEVSDWAATAEPGVTRVAEVWGSMWARLLAGCLATAAAANGPLYSVSLPVADDLVAGLKARGVAVRYRQARQSVVDDAELRALSQDRPLRHM